MSRSRLAKVGWVGPILLDDIHVRPRDAPPPPVRASGIEVSRGLLGMLLSGGDPGRIRVNGLEADIVFDAERHSNLERLFARKPRHSPVSLPRRGGRAAAR